VFYDHQGVLLTIRTSHPWHTHLTLVWSNFEIGDLDFWRGEAYMKYFTHLDEAGGFYYEVRRFTFTRD
jgi:hypothetical protein